MELWFPYAPITEPSTFRVIRAVAFRFSPARNDTLRCFMFSANHLRVTDRVFARGTYDPKAHRRLPLMRHSIEHRGHRI